MKIKIKQTTVWQIEVSLKTDRIINGKFNFTLLDHFYVTNLNNFVEKIIEMNNIRTYKLNEELNLGKDYIGGKIRYKEAIPIHIIKEILGKLSYRYNNERLINIFKENKSRFYYCGKSGPSRPIRLPFNTNEILDVIKFLRPYKNNKTYLLTRDNKVVKKVRNFFSVKESRRKDGLLEINSITLNRFLKYFFGYVKKPLLNFPLSNINFKDIDLIKGVVLPLLLTDGNVHRNKYSCYFDFFAISKNKKLHDIFADSSYLALNKYPSQYFSLKNVNDLRKTSFILRNKEAEKILKICNTTKTAPAKIQDKTDYLKEIQPSVDFLFKCNEKTKKMALRIWFCTEGSISFNRGKKYNTIRPCLNLSCANPKLIKQLKRLLGEFGIEMIIRKSKTNWSGFDGLYATKQKSITNFLKIGGFLPETYVWNSRFHKAVEKQKLLLGILEYISRERKWIYGRNIAIEKVHKEINKIVRMKQFKSPKDYILEHSIS